MTIENGIKKINASEDGLKAYIEEDPDGRLLIKVTRRYSTADLDTLMDEEPELYMHLQSIPDQTDDATVEVSVDVTREYEADSEEALEEDQPEVFEVYERFTSGSHADLQRLHEIPRIMIPELRAVPLEPGIRLEMMPPGNLRIHPEPTEPEQDEPADEDKDT